MERYLFVYGNQRQGLPEHLTVEGLQCLGTGTLETRKYSLYEHEGRPVLAGGPASVVTGEVYATTLEHIDAIHTRLGTHLFERKGCNVVIDGKGHCCLVHAARGDHPIHEAKSTLGAVLPVLEGDWAFHVDAMDERGLVTEGNYPWSKGFNGRVHRMDAKGKDLGIKAQALSQANKNFLLGKNAAVIPAHMEKTKSQVVDAKGTLTRSGERIARSMMDDLKLKIQDAVGQELTAGWDNVEPVAHDLYRTMVKVMATAGGKFEKDDRFVEKGQDFLELLGAKLQALVTRGQEAPDDESSA